jgi:hypothetical protein
MIVGYTGCGNSTFNCYPEVAAATEGSAFSQMPGEKQIPRAKSALGMTKSAFFPQPVQPLSFGGMVERPFWQYP